MLGSEPPPASIQWGNPLSRRGWFFPSNVTYAYFNIKNFALVEVSSRFFLPFMSSQVRGAVVMAAVTAAMAVSRTHVLGRVPRNVWETLLENI